MDAVLMDKMEDILSACEYNGGGHIIPFRKYVAECWEHC